ncbi:hypothetical protein K435DRAFT_798178 [Dendrothele bispora CBS 962.96]|uniref:Uncharacterized protein n=2 Tax=Dendrothele bispora (strain CBS 962.96) TaxID=1314807 RepID=A0A4S8M046_DENBC|nr:hypothetical protein K435DRAFT_798178 [Dendrothele bispora CBS 962.96]
MDETLSIDDLDSLPDSANEDASKKRQQVQQKVKVQILCVKLLRRSRITDQKSRKAGKTDYAFFLHPVDRIKFQLNAKLFNPPGTIYHTEADRIDAWGSDHIAKAASTVIQYERLESKSTVTEMTMSTLKRMWICTRGPYKKVETATSSKISESIDTDGRLPGSKDGLGAFPPGSDWAKTMLDLKLKGKKYKTKKERLRVEKEGPPVCADGSMDYYNMEDPFSLLSALVPDSLARPLLTPLYPPISRPSTQRQPSYDPSASQTPQPPPSSPASGSTNAKTRHWTITRNASSRKMKDREDDRDDSGELPEWKVPREAHALDFGSFALLAGELAEEMQRRGLSGDDEETCLNILKDTLDCEIVAKQLSYKDRSADFVSETSYFNSVRAAEAEDYVRDVVYGGVDGLAYARSIAEFVAPIKDSDSSHNTWLARWAQENVLDPLTDGRHSLLRETALLLALRAGGKYQTSDEVSVQLNKSLDTFPSATQALQTLLQIRTHKIDMGALIKVPEELFQSEQVWAGRDIKAKQMAKNSPESGGQPISYELESNEDLNQVLAYVADAISDQSKSTVTAIKAEDSEASSEDSVMRKIRLNLLALAKRAPIDTIARVPKDMVPEHIRQYIPTVDT